MAATMPATPEQCRRYRMRLKIRARDLLGHTCRDCGNFIALEFAHVKATGLCGAGRGQTRRMLDVIRNPECYCPLCPDCHKKRDKRNGGRQIAWDDLLRGALDEPSQSTRSEPVRPQSYSVDDVPF